jgi:hypothetical protein
LISPVEHWFKKNINHPFGYGSKPWQLMNPKIASKWMFIPLKLIIIGFGPIPFKSSGGSKSKLGTPTTK